MRIRDIGDEERNDVESYLPLGLLSNFLSGE